MANKINFGNLNGILSSGVTSAKKSISDFFALMGGLDATIASQIDPVIRAKHVHFGMFLTIVVLIQAVIAGSAWSDLMHSVVIGIFVFIAWMVLFGALDSVMMNLMNRELAKSRGYSWMSIGARVVIIGFTSYLNSTMAEMRIFDAEIKKSIYEFRQEEFKTLSSVTELKIDSLRAKQQANQKLVDQKSVSYTNWLNAEQAKIDAQKRVVQQRRDELVKEVEGSAGTGRRGDGAVADAKRVALAQEESVLSDQIAALEIAKLARPEYTQMQSEIERQKDANAKIDAQITEEQENLKNRKSEIKEMRNDGFLDRYHALERIGDDNLLVLVVWAFFFFIEMSILIVKLTMMGRDEYHDILNNHLNKVYKDVILEKKEDLERAISNHEEQMDNILLARTEKRMVSEASLNAAELALYPIEIKRMQDQFAHAKDVTEIIDRSTQDQSVKSLFKFTWAKKFFRLQPEQMN